jgi:hypothetical protein
VLTTPTPKMPQLGPKIRFERSGGGGGDGGGL